MAGQGPDVQPQDVQPQLPAGSGRGKHPRGRGGARPGRPGTLCMCRRAGGTGAPQGGDPTGCGCCVLLF